MIFLLLQQELSLMRQNGFGEAPVLFARTKELPRGALVEYQCNLHTGRRMFGAMEIGEEYDDEDDDLEPKCSLAEAVDGALRWVVCESSGAKRAGLRAVVFAYREFVLGLQQSGVYTLNSIGIEDLKPIDDDQGLRETLGRAVSVKVYRLLRNRQDLGQFPHTNGITVTDVRLLRDQWIAWSSHGGQGKKGDLA